MAEQPQLFPTEPDKNTFIPPRIGSFDGRSDRPIRTDEDIRRVDAARRAAAEEHLPPAELGGPGHIAAREAAQAIANQLEAERQARQ